MLSSLILMRFSSEEAYSEKSFESVAVVTYSVSPSSTASKSTTAKKNFTWQSKRFHPEVRGGSKVLGDSVDCNFASLYYRWMAVFHTTTTEGRSAVIDYYFDYQVKYPMTMIPTKDNTIKQQ